MWAIEDKKIVGTNMNNEGGQVYIERDLPGKWAGRDSSATYQLSLVIHASFLHFCPFRKAASNMSCDRPLLTLLALKCLFILFHHLALF